MPGRQLWTNACWEGNCEEKIAGERDVEKKKDAGKGMRQRGLGKVM